MIRFAVSDSSAEACYNNEPLKTYRQRIITTTPMTDVPPCLIRLSALNIYYRFRYTMMYSAHATQQFCPRMSCGDAT